MMRFDVCFTNREFDLKIISGKGAEAQGTLPREVVIARLDVLCAFALLRGNSAGNQRLWPSAFSIVVVLAFSWLSDASTANERVAERGVVDFAPTATEASVPQRFRQTAHSFGWEASRMRTVTDTLEVWDVTFPSPVSTAEAANNTVHAEYYCSRRDGKRPAVIVLHILGGDFPLSRLFSNSLAQHGVNALFVKMPYYGPRRDPSSLRRMVSPDPRETVAGMTQAVLDIRRATAWLANRAEIDTSQLGVFGISLGGITGALAAAAEPRLQNVCLLLAGGDIAQPGWDAPQAHVVRERWLAEGHSREEFVEILRAVDPVTYAAGVRGKRILLLNATHDEVIPRACTESLWKSLGEPEIHWLPGGHFSVSRHLFTALLQVGKFFGKE